MKPTSIPTLPAVNAGGQSRRAGTGARFTRDQFAHEFALSSRAMWCIAAAVIGDKSRAEDVVQEAALAALQKLDEFEPGTSFLAWMGKFVRYTALNEARRRKMRAAASLDAVDSPVAGPVAVEESSDARTVTSVGSVTTDQRVFDDHVAAALNMLDEIARACLLLRTVHDMPYKEISLALDVPEGTAMSHVHRARKLMRDHLSDHYQSTSGRRTE